MINQSHALSLVCIWLTSVVDCFKFKKSEAIEKEKYESMLKEYLNKEKVVSSLEKQVDAANKALEKSEAILASETVILNNENDDLIYLD